MYFLSLKGLYQSINQSINSRMKENKVLYVVDGMRIEMYNIEENTITERRSMVENSQITTAVFIQSSKKDAIAYGTKTGRVCIEYMTEGEGCTGYVYKAHKKDVGTDEIFYTVTMIHSVSTTEIVTGGTDGKLYMWNIHTKKRTKIVYKTDKMILHGDVKVKNSRIDSLALVLSTKADGILDIEDTQDIVIVRVE